MPDKTRTKFETPPINELVMGISFVPVIELRAQHIGIYWNLVKARFPICQQQPPFVSSPAAAVFQEMPGEIFPLPRFWFSSGPESSLVQIQRDMFMLNWRKGQTNTYPHYENVVSEFWKELLIFDNFLKEETGDQVKAVNQCELTYINLIDTNHMFSNRSELKAIIPSISGLCDIETEVAKLAGLNAVASYQIDTNLRLDVTIKSGMRQDTQAAVGALELKVVGAPNGFSLDAARTWYDAAHDVIHEFFLRLTTERAQKELWKPI